MKRFNDYEINVQETYDSMSLKPWKVLETSYFRPRFRIDKCELSNGNLLDATIT